MYHLFDGVRGASGCRLELTVNIRRTASNTFFSVHPAGAKPPQINSKIRRGS